MLKKIVKIVLLISIIGFLVGMLIMSRGNHNIPIAFVPFDELNTFHKNYQQNFDFPVIKSGLSCVALSLLCMVISIIILDNIKQKEKNHDKENF